MISIYKVYHQVCFYPFPLHVSSQLPAGIVNSAALCTYVIFYENFYLYQKLPGALGVHEYAWGSSVYFHVIYIRGTTEHCRESSERCDFPRNDITKLRIYSSRGRPEGNVGTTYRVTEIGHPVLSQSKFKSGPAAFHYVFYIDFLDLLNITEECNVVIMQYFNQIEIIINQMVSLQLEVVWRGGQQVWG